MPLDRRSQRHRAFTLVELLTVISIITLLIAILLPSLRRARQQARRAKDQKLLRVLESGLETYHHDFGRYPDSAEGPDGLLLPGDAAPARKMPGAYWMARALGGFDSLGVDTKAVMLEWAAGAALTPQDFHLPGGRYAERRGAYIDTRSLGNSAGFDGNTGGSRLMVQDEEGAAVLYYAANSRKQDPFSICGIGTKPVGSDPEDFPGIYNQSDNAVLTGGYTAQKFSGHTASDPVAAAGVDFARTGFKHGLGYFPKDPTNLHEKPPADYKGKNFIDDLHSEVLHQTSGVVRPANPDTFILISAGSDGLYGTEDDVTNIKAR
jgi:prepilin-type N-terminal cleavage/methylation domain-containing protein